MRDPEIFCLSGGSSVPVSGLLPLGYQARDRKLVMVEIEVKSPHLPPLCRTGLGTIVEG
jgi:hypothetical protein